MNLDELFHAVDLSWLQKPDVQVETSTIERKADFDIKEVARQISSFGNAQGGLLVLGVTKEGALSGLDPVEIDDNLPRLHNAISNVPGWSWTSERRVVGDKEVLLILVPPSRARVVFTSAKEAYQRRGTSSLKLSQEAVRELQQRSLEAPFEDEPVIPFDVGLLDPQLVSELQRKLAESQTLENPVELDLFNRRLLVERDGLRYLTVAGLLTLGKDPQRHVPGASVRVLKFDGAEEKVGTERNVVKDETFEGPIPRLIPAVRDFVRSQLREYDFYLDGKFVKVSEYPAAAWEEAIVNAVVHRSYHSRSSIFVKLFADRLEVQSPGGFPRSVTPENLVHEPTNPHLAGALSRFALVRLANEGTRRMKDEMSKAGLPPPRFRESPERDRVTVTLFNEIQQRVAATRNDPNEVFWRAVEADLSDPLPLLRSKALDRWRVQSNQGKGVPVYVIERAIQLLDNVGPGLRKQIVELLAEQRETPEDLRCQVVMQFLNSERWAAEVETAQAASRLAHYSPKTVAAVLEWFETRWGHETPSHPSLPQARLASDILTTYLRLDQQPSREVVVRILKAARSYKPEVVKELTALINGQADS
jgi:ATP-dependent DNA helicase RecG